MTAPVLVLRHATVLDPAAGVPVPDQDLVIEDGRIVEIDSRAGAGANARSIDVRGRTVLPGLIDAHVHVTAVTADLAALSEMSPALVTARAARLLREMLLRGFTTVRDAGGADSGLAAAITQGYLTGPRVVFGGKALSQTGGHGDMRGPGRWEWVDWPGRPGLSRLCDGVAEVRRAARDELRQGAHHIKLMLSGGVASPTDRVDSMQFSDEEVRAAVEETSAANRYVAGHAYTARAVNRALALGVRSIEHGNLLDETTIPLFIERGAFYVPTLVTYRELAQHGAEWGLPEKSRAKVFDVLDAGVHALELAHRGGVAIAYGTDLLGGMQGAQLDEFTLRGEVQPPLDVLRSATSVAARLVGMEGQIGAVAVGARADLLVVDGDPLADLRVLTAPERHLSLLLHGGAIVKNEIEQ